MVKILHVIPSLGVGGTEKMLLELCRGLDRSRFTPSVVSLKTGGATANNLMRENVRVHPLNSPDNFWQGALDGPRLWVELRKKIRETSPDILHTWLTRANVIGRLASIGTRLPVISSLRVMEKEKIYHILAEKLTHRLSDRVTVNCTPLKDFAVRWIGIPESKVDVIFNGVPPPPARAAEAGARDRPLVIGAMGRLHKQKGFDLLIQAVPKILSRHPAARFLIAGEGPEKKRLQSLIKRLKLNSVELPGLAGSADFISALDIFVLSSRWEGMPNVVLEAMAQGVPVAAARVGGVTDLIEDGKEGLLFASGDVDAMADACARLAESPESRNELSRAAETKVKEKFSMAAMIESYSKLYEQTLSRG